MNASDIRFSLNAKIALWGASVVALTAAALLAIAAWQSGAYNRLAQDEVDRLIDADLDHITHGVCDILSTEDVAVRQQLETNLNVARRLLETSGGLRRTDGTIAWTAVNQETGLRTEALLPAMRLGEALVRANPDPAVPSPVVDEASRLVGGTATLFQRMNAAGDMLRIVTNVHDADGRRAVGTFIPAVEPDGSRNPVVAAVLSGARYIGMARVVDTPYLAAYEAVRDASAEAIGMLYVGIPLASVEDRVRRTVEGTAIGASGYVFALRGSGQDRGRYIVSQHGARDGENVWDSRDSDGSYMIREILAKAVPLAPRELATHRYRWQNPGEPGPRWKVARLAYFAPWDWVVGTSAYEDELLPYRQILADGRRRMSAVLGAAGIVIALLMGGVGISVAWTIVRPIRQITTAASSMDGGHLGRKVETRSGDEIGVLARAFNEMTERLRTTLDGLRQSEEKYRDIFENAVEGLCRTTPEGRFLSANPALARMLGYDDPGELLRGVRDIGRELYADPADRARLLATMQAEGQVLGQELRFRRRDGSFLWVSIDLRLVRDAAGKPLYIDSYVRDDTEHRAADEAVRAANERFRSVLRASAGYSIIGMDLDGRILVFNEGAESMLGYRADDVLEKASILAIHDPAEIAARAAELGAEPGLEALVAVPRREGIEMREWSYLRKDGSRLTVSLSVAPMRGETGELSGFIGIARDVTGEKRMEEQLLQSRKMESIGLLAGGVAHDFNNLLTPILGNAELLLADLPAGDARAASVEEVRRAAERARDLTRKLLAFGRKQLIQLSILDLGEVVRRFEDILRRTIREDVRIEVRIPEGLGPVRADPGQIEQVLLNLAVNAQDAMPSGGRLAIAAQNVDLDADTAAGYADAAPGAYVMLEVSDSGTGMDKSTRTRIFEPFFTTKGPGKGTGLGLPTVYGIVRQHGGFLSVYSEPGMGSTFKIYLPRAAPQARTGEDRGKGEETAVQGTETVLVAEDNEMVRDLACRMLRRLGYRVLESEGADRCLALAAESREPIHMLLTDMVMPGKNGRELYEALRRVHPGLRVLYMSGYASHVMGDQGILEEGMQFLQKPFSLQALARKVRLVLDAPPIVP